MVNAIGAAHWKKGTQMRYKAVFFAGVAVGFVAGTRAGRGAYDKMVGYGKQVASHPKVQQATSAAQAKAAGLAKTAAAKAPDYAKNAAASAARTAQAQVSHVPKYVSSARHAAAGKLPGRSGGTAGTPAADAAADGTATTSAKDDIAPDGNLVYPADDGSPSANGLRYSPDTP
jgi:hypothetical protein